MTQKRLLSAAAALALLAVIFFLTRGGGGEAVDSPQNAQAQTGGQDAAGTASPGRKPTGPAQPGSPQQNAAAPTSDDATSGKVFAQGAWGTGPNDFGRYRVPESNPEAPMAISMDAQGNAYVLDQVNGRILRFDKNGKPLEPFQITQQAPREIVVAPNGATLILDQARDKSVAVLDQDGKLIGDLPITGKHLSDKESGAATGIFTDVDGVYVEKKHAMQFRVGDAAGNPDPNQPLMDGRPSRDGTSLLSMGMINALAGRFWVRATDRRTGQMKFMREYTLPAPIMFLTFLDSDSSGRIYAAAHVGRELPIDPRDGGHGGGFTDESIQFLCLTPMGEPRHALTLPANTMPEDTARDLAVGNDGTILYMYRSETGMKILQYTCG
jgi:hypothetical protein